MPPSIFWAVNSWCDTDCFSAGLLRVFIFTCALKSSSFLVERINNVSQRYWIQISHHPSCISGIWTPASEQWVLQQQQWQVATRGSSLMKWCGEKVNQRTLPSKIHTAFFLLNCLDQLPNGLPVPFISQSDMDMTKFSGMFFVTLSYYLSFSLHFGSSAWGREVSTTSVNGLFVRGHPWRCTLAVTLSVFCKSLSHCHCWNCQASLIQCLIGWPHPLLGRQVGAGVWIDLC